VSIPLNRLGVFLHKDHHNIVFFMLSYRKNISNRQTSSQKMISIKIEKHIYTIEIENKK